MRYDEKIWLKQYDKGILPAVAYQIISGTEHDLNWDMSVTEGFEYDSSKLWGCCLCVVGQFI